MIATASAKFQGRLGRLESQRKKSVANVPELSDGCQRDKSTAGGRSTERIVIINATHHCLPKFFYHHAPIYTLSGPQMPCPFF